MRDGEIVEQGPAEQVLRDPQHAYTRALLDADPVRRTRGHRLRAAAHGAVAIPRAPRRRATAASPVARGARTSSSATAGPTGRTARSSTTSRSTLCARRDARHRRRVRLGQEHDGAHRARRSSSARRAARCCCTASRGRALPSASAGRGASAISRRLPGPAELVRPALDRRADPRRRARRATVRDRRAAPRTRVVASCSGRSASTRRTCARRRCGCPAASGSGSRSRGPSRPSPTVIVCDEPVSALDVSIQAQILDLLVDLQARPAASATCSSPTTSASIRHLSDRVLVMKDGRGRRDRDRRRASSSHPRDHPYTRSSRRAAELPTARRRVADDPAIRRLERTDHDPTTALQRCSR